ncbi:MAG: DNA repair protein RecO, partial [Candidatus Marinimicrobia bacterium]|nr:DNA repair protein RecO [Candidatus Neomarinimicrobiota bacterium]
MQNTQAIVLKMKQQGESSALLHTYSRDYGKLILIAKGARSSKSAFRGLLEPFSFLNIHYNEKKGRAYQFLSQSEFLNPFSNLKKRPAAVLYGSVILEILYKIQDTQADPQLFDLLKNVLEAMDKGADAVLMHAYFILHYLRIEGLMLDPEHCFQCGGIPVKAYFLPLMGQMLSGNCQKDHAPVWELPDMLLSLLNMMMHADVVQMEKQKIADA